jgi:hypothetical protein
MRRCDHSDCMQHVYKSKESGVDVTGNEIAYYSGVEALTFVSNGIVFVLVRAWTKSRVHNCSALALYCNRSTKV